MFMMAAGLLLKLGVLKNDITGVGQGRLVRLVSNDDLGERK